MNRVLGDRFERNFAPLLLSLFLPSSTFIRTMFLFITSDSITLSILSPHGLLFLSSRDSLTKPPRPFCLCVRACVRACVRLFLLYQFLLQSMRLLIRPNGNRKVCLRSLFEFHIESQCFYTLHLYKMLMEYIMKKSNSKLNKCVLGFHVGMSE